MTAGMHSLRKRFVPALIISLCTILLPLSGCKIVPNDQRTSAGGSSTKQSAAENTAAGFDANSYVDSVWDAQLVPHFDTQANELATVIEAIKTDLDEAGKKFGQRPDAEGSPWSFAVKAQARIVAVNTESRAGTMLVEIATSSGPQQVTLQIGPVIKGSAIRDSLPFFSFGKVTNQLEFAQVGRAFNDRALKQIQAALPALKEAGTSVEFIGAISITGEPESFVVTPVSIKPVAGGNK